MTQGTATTEEELPTAAIDTVATYIDTYRALEKQIKDLVDMRDNVRREIEAALGDNQIGTVQGRRVVSYRRFTQHRLSIPAIRRKFSDQDLQDCYVDVPQSRFMLVG